MNKTFTATVPMINNFEDDFQLQQLMFRQMFKPFSLTNGPHRLIVELQLQLFHNTWSMVCHKALKIESYWYQVKFKYSTVLWCCISYLFNNKLAMANNPITIIYLLWGKCDLWCHLSSYRWCVETMKVSFTVLLTTL